METLLPAGLSPISETLYDSVFHFVQERQHSTRPDDVGDCYHGGRSGFS